MKNLTSLVALLIVFRAGAQPTYTVDSSAFNALNLEGGKAEMVFADIDQNGHLDILTVGDHGSPYVNTNQHGISVFFGNGTATAWTLFQTGDFGYGGIAVGDVNNDRFLDVAYGIHHDYSATDFGDQLIEAVIGNGTGMVWVPWDDSLANSGETWGMFGTDLGDVDNDGWLDIGSGSFGCCAGTHVYLNNKDGSWKQSFGYTGGNNGKYFEFGDLNHDGNLDFVCCNNNGAVYFGDGTGAFTKTMANLPLTGNFGYTDVSLGDVDSDGDDDFAFIVGGLPYVYAWYNPSQQWYTLMGGLPVSGTYRDVELADLDMDGFMDLVAVKTGAVEFWKGNGGTLWTLMQNFSFPTLNNASDITVDDADHNGYPDVLLWAEYYISLFTYDNKLRLFRENTVATTLNVTMQYPKNYECIPAGSVRFIRWISAVPANHVSTVQIEFSSTGPGGPWNLVDNGLPNNGSYQWDVPVGVASSDCYLRLTAIDSVTLLTDTAVNTNPFQVGVCNPALGVQDAVHEAPAVSAWPNPFHDALTVYSDCRGCDVELIDGLGRAVYSARSVKSFPHVIECLSLPAGLYVVRVTSSGGTVLAGKVMGE